jgi:hypothetical protein
MKSIWEEYSNEAEALAKRLGKIVRKRELTMMTKNDKVLADTLADELRSCIEDVIQSQDKLTGIHQDPSQLLDVIGMVIGMPKERRDAMITEFAARKTDG